MADPYIPPAGNQVPLELGPAYTPPAGNSVPLEFVRGGGGPKPFDMPMPDFRRAFDLNVFSLFRLAQLAAPEMAKAGGGSILAITSMAAENKNQRMAAYASSKAATSHLVRNIAFDLGPKNIRVNGVAPGATRTDALRSVLTEAIETRMLAHTPPSTGWASRRTWPTPRCSCARRRRPGSAARS